jgi:hypothetical protein
MALTLSHLYNSKKHPTEPSGAFVYIFLRYYYITINSEIVGKVRKTNEKKYFYARLFAFSLFVVLDRHTSSSPTALRLFVSRRWWQNL